MDHLEAATGFIHTQIAAGKKVLVHCKAGVSRSPTVVLAYLTKYGNMNLREAYFLLKERRNVIAPNQGFWKQLVEFEKIAKGENSVKIVVTDLWDEWPGITYHTLFLWYLFYLQDILQK